MNKIVDYKKIRRDIINGKKKYIYMKPTGKREYVKSKGELVLLSVYIKTLQKKMKINGGGSLRKIKGFVQGLTGLTPTINIPTTLPPQQGPQELSPQQLREEEKRRKKFKKQEELLKAYNSGQKFNLLRLFNNKQRVDEGHNNSVPRAPPLPTSSRYSNPVLSAPSVGILLTSDGYPYPVPSAPPLPASSHTNRSTRSDRTSIVQNNRHLNLITTASQVQQVSQSPNTQSSHSNTSPSAISRIKKIDKKIFDIIINKIDFTIIKLIKLIIEISSFLGNISYFNNQINIIILASFQLSLLMFYICIQKIEANKNADFITELNNIIFDNHKNILMTGGEKKYINYKENNTILQKVINIFVKYKSIEYRKVLFYFFIYIFFNVLLTKIKELKSVNKIKKIKSS